MDQQSTTAGDDNVAIRPICPECSSVHLTLGVTLRNNWSAQFTCKACGHRWEATWDNIKKSPPDFLEIQELH